MLGNVPTALEGGDEWKIQGLKMGLWEEYTKLEKMDEAILGIMAKIGGWIFRKTKNECPPGYHEA